MRLIDAHKLWDVMNKATLNHIVTNTLWNTLKSVIENAPTIDAVEVVRCKDCRWATVRDEYIGRLWCSIHRGYMEDTYYCADGLRREDGEA